MEAVGPRTDDIHKLRNVLVSYVASPQGSQGEVSRSSSFTESPSTPAREHSYISCSHYTPINPGINESSDYCSSDDFSTEPGSMPLLVPVERFSSATLARQERKDQANSNTLTQLTAIVVACLLWVAVSSATILINKHIMVDLSFHFPAAVAALGMAGTTVASFLACVVFRLAPCKATVSPYFFFTRVLSTAFFTALSFQAGNTAYLYLSVAFVQMLKAFTPVSTMLCGFMFNLERPSSRLIAAVCCICCGVVISSYGEVNFSAFGVTAMLTSVAAEGLRIVMMQHMLAAKQFSPLEAWMYLGPACCIWLVVLIGVFEIHQIQDQHGLSIVLDNGWCFGCAALAGFLVNALAMVVIKLASALTLKVLGICKDIGLVASGVILLGEHITGLQVCGYSLSLMGFAMYNYIKAGGAALPDCSRHRQLQQQLLQPTEKSKLPRTPSPLRRKPGLIGAVTVPSQGLTDPLLPPHSLSVSLKVAV